MTSPHTGNIRAALALVFTFGTAPYWPNLVSLLASAL